VIQFEWRNPNNAICGLVYNLETRAILNTIHFR